MDFTSYADFLAEFGDKGGSVRAENVEARVLDPKDGFAARVMAFCDEQIQEAEDPRRDFDLTDDELQSFRLERDTWDIVQQLYCYRKTKWPVEMTPQQMLADNPYKPPDMLLFSILRTSTPSSTNSTTLAELQLILNWLQKTAPPPPPANTAIGYRKFTKARLLQAKRTGQWGAVEGMVRELDPDGVHHVGDGLGKLAPEDEAMEQALLKSIFMFIRSGRQDEVPALCRAANEPWRGAVIRGGETASCPALGSFSSEEDNLYKWKGNKRRRLFKSVCTRAALDPSTSTVNRLVYATLAPSHATLHILLGSLTEGEGFCQTWSDLLWARVNVLFQERWESLMRKFEQFSKKFVSADTMEEDDKDGHEWEEDVISMLSGMESVEVREGPDAQNPYHITQLYMILNRTDLLLLRMADLFSDGMPDEDRGRDYESYCHYLRFFAHLCLYLQFLNVPLPHEAADTILQAYVNLLESTNQGSLIALYSAALGDNAIDRYSAYLIALPLSVPAYQRIEALNQAEKVGLDVNRVAVRASEEGAERVFETLPAARDIASYELHDEEELPEAELYLTRCMEWTSSSPATYESALILSNRCILYFLSIGKPHAAGVILDYLPNDLISQIVLPAEDEAKTEHVSWQKFVTAWRAYQRVAECKDEEMDVEHSAADQKGAWMKKYGEALENCWSTTVPLLTDDWLKDMDVDRTREEDYARIRKIYIPELVLHLHYALLDSCRWFDRSHKRIFELVNIMADGRYNLHEEFMHVTHPDTDEPTQLQRYLDGVKSAAIAVLDKGGSDPFHGIT